VEEDEGGKINKEKEEEGSERGGEKEKGA